MILRSHRQKLSVPAYLFLVNLVEVYSAEIEYLHVLQEVKQFFLVKQKNLNT